MSDGTPDGGGDKPSNGQPGPGDDEDSGTPNDGDAGVLASKQARILSVAPTYTVAEETYKYRPKSSSAEQAVWKIEQGPPGLVVEDDGSTISWKPTSDQKGLHSVTLKTEVGGHVLSQSGEITVAVAEERAAVDVDEKSGGSAIVTAPKSRVAGASVFTRPASLKEPKRLTISEVDTAPAMGIAKGGPRTVQFGPAGTVFSEPALITLPLEGDGVSNKSRVGAFVYDPKGRWVRVPVVSVDTDKGVVHAKAKHFSLYAAAETKLGLSVSANTAPESSACPGSLFVNAWVEEPFSELQANQVSNLADQLLALAGDTSLAALVAQDGVTGSFRFVRVVELGQGDAGDRVVLESRLLVSTLYLRGDGSAVVTHSDALGNLLGSFTFASIRNSATELWTHLSGRAVRAVFDTVPSSDISVSARLHALYFADDASLDPVSADDLGFALVDVEALKIDKPTADARDADLDCDGLLKAFDGMDDRLMPRIVARPAGVVSAVAGHPVRLSAQLLNAPAGTTLSWRVLAGSASLNGVANEPSARDFVAAQAGRFLVEASAAVEEEPLSAVFAIDVTPELTLPKCLPSPDRSTIKEGEGVALSAVLGDKTLSTSGLELKWGLLVDGALVPSTDLSPRGGEARFTPSVAGRYAVACRVSLGAREGALGDTSIDVVPAQNNLPPTDLILSPSYQTLLVGESLTFAAQGRDPEGGVLTFGWITSGGTLGTAQGGRDNSRVGFSAAQPGLFEVRVAAKDPAGASQEINAFVLVVTAAADTQGEDADADGWPSKLDCNDKNPKINPGVVDRCGDDIDDDCSGAPAKTDCDDDGFSIEQGDCNDQNRDVSPRTVERCDGIDNNCDGQRDEGFSVGATCSVGRGQCAKSAIWVCSTDGFGAVCPVTPQRSSAELCDGVDNDCDGVVDEDYVSRAATCGVGACATNGVTSCVAGKEQSSCVPRPAAPADLTCDGVDDDCNGQVDEDVVKLVEVCNGIDDNCDRRIDEGLSCSGTTAACVPKGAETCNGLDDDCNGRFDEGSVCGVAAEAGNLLGVYWACSNAACTALDDGGFMFLRAGAGLKLESFEHTAYDPTAGPYCVERNFQYSAVGNQLSLSWLDDDQTQKSASGTFVVAGAHLTVSFVSGPADMLGTHELIRVPEQAGGACPMGPVCQTREICGNGFDDNCDGKTDKEDQSCAATCAGGGTTEICDQLDNDCNGQVDDLTQPCTRADAVGACQAGHMACPQTGNQPTCVAGAPDAQGELCSDGVDNDCDGATDEAGCVPLSAGETCFNAIDISQGGVFTLAKGQRNDVLNGCRPANYLDRVFYLQTPAGLYAQQMFVLDSATKIDVGATLYKAPAGYALGQACPAFDSAQAICINMRASFTQYLEPASTYLLVVEAAPDSAQQGGTFTLSVARNNDGSCAPGDTDQDGTTICAGDCNDAVQAVHPGATELCNQVDDDCDGQIDEQDGICQTGLPGSCAVGISECNQNPACQPIQHSARDYCNDGIDNDCNGAVDDNCLVAAGETCDNAIDMGNGGAFAGTLVGASDDAISRCGGAGPERFYRFTLPTGGGYVTLSQATMPGAVRYSIYKDCTLNVLSCGGKLQRLPEGTYYVGVEVGAANEAQPYAFTFGIGDGNTCFTPDLDTDGKTACYDDCDEAQASVNRGVPESSTCDGIDNDCNGAVDDVKAPCAVQGKSGICATGTLRCDPKTGSACQQTVFPDAQGRDICGDGLDNDCDGAADAQDPQLCVSVPAGDVCGLAFQANVTGGGVFPGTLAGYADDMQLGCGDNAASGVERFYSVTLSERRVLRAEVRQQGAQGDTGYMGLAMVDSCASSSGTGVYCASSYFSRELDAGTYVFAVFGPSGRTFDLLVSSQLSGDSAGTTCQPADLDGDRFTLCNGDCKEGNSAVFPGAAEVCDGVDNDCNMVADDKLAPQPCEIGGGIGECSHGSLGCAQGAPQCVAAGPKPEICNDGRDNDCDGSADDRGTPGVDCTPLAGDTCQDAMPIAPAGFFNGDLAGAANDGGGCYGGTQGTAEERYYSFNTPAAGYYYLQVRPVGQAPFPPHSAGIFSGACGVSMSNDGCSDMGGRVLYYYLNSAGPHYVVVESDDPFAYRIGLATLDGNGQCTIPDGDGDGLDFCNFDCDDGNPNIHPGATDLCNGVDDNCNGSIDEGC